MPTESIRVKIEDNKLLKEAAARFGTPVYVYFERQLRESCREMRGLLGTTCFSPRFSIKANANPYLLRIIRQEGFGADAMSPGEIHLLLKCDFTPGEILFVAQNASVHEAEWAYKMGCTICFDSLDLLEAAGRSGIIGEAALRINPGIGDGHSRKVITAGEHSQFGIPIYQFDEALMICTRLGMKIIGLHQHIGSSFLKPDIYVRAGKILARLCKDCPDLQWLDIGGGFGIPYSSKDPSLDLSAVADGLQKVLSIAQEESGKELILHIEPGRYITAECGCLVGRVMSVKKGKTRTFVGTDLGFHRLIRPTLYGAVHRPVILTGESRAEAEYAIVGNACETGDFLCRNCRGALPETGDMLALEKAGAYGYAMSFPYVGRTRPAEVLIYENGEMTLIRKHEPISNLWALVPGFENAYVEESISFIL